MFNFLFGLWLAVTPIGFHQLAQMDTPQEVQIRGFLYRADDGRWVLAEEPNLKSCCIGASHNAERQVVLNTDYVEAPLGFVVTVEGNLLRSRSYLADRKLASLYALENPQIIANKSHCLPCILILIVSVGIAYAYTVFRKRRA